MRGNFVATVATGLQLVAELDRRKNGVPRDSSRRKTSVSSGWQSHRLVTGRALHTWASITQSVFAFALPASAKCTLTVLIS